MKGFTYYNRNEIPYQYVLRQGLVLQIQRHSSIDLYLPYIFKTWVMYIYALFLDNNLYFAVLHV